jgi:chorismate mutase
MPTRGIRGATTVTADEPDLILKATDELLESILDTNPGLNSEDIGSVLFTVTEDLASAFPAQAVRQLGWDKVPIMCANEIPVKGSLPLCIRVLIHWNTDKSQNEINHVYLRDAINLRPDLTTNIKEKSR